MSTDDHEPPSGCNYAGHEFGASYPDSICIEGYLWDADSCDEPGDTKAEALDGARWFKAHAKAVLNGSIERR